MHGATTNASSIAQQRHLQPLVFQSSMENQYGGTVLSRKLANGQGGEFFSFVANNDMEEQLTVSNTTTILLPYHSMVIVSFVHGLGGEANKRCSV